MDIDINDERYIRLSKLTVPGLLKRYQSSETSSEDRAMISILLEDEGIDPSDPSSSAAKQAAELDKGLAGYLATTIGVSRLVLNVLCALGLAVFGWMLIIVYGLMGQNRNSAILSYGAPVAISASFMMTKHPYQYMGILSEKVFLAGVLLYILGWINANVLLSRCQKTAKLMSELDPTDSEADVIVAALLRAKYSRKEDGVEGTLKGVDDLSNVSSELAGAAGEHLRKVNPSEATRYFDAAIATGNEREVAQYSKARAKLTNAKSSP